MRSDSNLEIFTFPSEKRNGLLMQSDRQHPTGQNVIESPTAQVVRSRQIWGQILGPNLTRPIGFSNRKMASLFNQVKS